ncbi:hypothetical protein VTL71DRAFT_1080 [Oculimacula yallundae]|uniref:ABM domain-containing protein n=1 Tax=Oculimacula yallundae TaxID=86028 RepID=A0ABR4D1U1_9HELO
MADGPAVTATPLRFIISGLFKELPDEPKSQLETIGQIICNSWLRRPWISQDSILPLRCDTMFFVTEWTSKEGERAWFVYDFNVKEHLNMDQLLQVDHWVYQIRMIGQA